MTIPRHYYCFISSEEPRSKLDKARELGVKIIDAAGLEEMVGGSQS